MEKSAPPSKAPKGKGYPYTDYWRQQSSVRRAEARALGLCESLDKKDVKPGLNPRTGKAYRTCPDCITRQTLTHRNKRESVRAAEAQRTHDTDTAQGEHEHDGAKRGGG